MRRLVLLLLIVFSITGYTWNGAGHKLVAQIAYDNLSPHAKKMCSQIFQVREQDLESYFVTISTWLDDIRKKNLRQFNSLHYIDIPFTKDKSKLMRIKPRNAVWAIKQAILVLNSAKTNNATKALYLKILIHVVGDIHQPLHASTKVSRRFPKGDLGGNLYLFSSSPYGKNLHQYWDNGAGFLNNKTPQETRIKAHFLEKNYPCKLVQQQKPEQWADRAHFIAANQAYSLRTHKKPNKDYQYNTRQTTEQQIALAGCRLARVLNTLAS
ncbi:S1/P1 nuclease [Legionella sp. km772]|uniref:S1/P1 nuclease n=1 Tax=Legionella sp. km772 TaxID=2498111 RepID=UPI000F8D89F6|nr:S1/P1 nuclease [Legionella sp. km772]RUR13185.1 nuclease [Legionella sp. km772]